LTSDLKTYLDDRPGQVSVAIRDLSSGITYGCQHRAAYVTRQHRKVDILVALLLACAAGESCI